MNIVLVDNLLIEQNGGRVETVLQPHLGLISLLAVIRSQGHTGYLYDPKFALTNGELRLDQSLYIEMAKQILEAKPDVVGLTSLGCNFICTLKVAQHLRQFSPDMPILLGGPHATILDKQILQRYDAFDLIVRHEAEDTICEVLNRLSTGGLSVIPGITFRRDNKVVANPGAPLIEDLDRLPLPSYADYPIERLGLEWLRVEAGRGCPFMCTFCSTATFFGRQFRLKSASRLVHELDQLHETYKVDQFSLQHDLFTVSRDKVLEFCEAVAARNYKWKCSARMDCVDGELLMEMSRAGCREIYFGVETGSPFLQQAAKKRLDLSVFYPALDACDAAGIAPTVSFITGYPQERAIDQAATLDMVGSCFYRNPPPANVQLHLMTPEPGTELIQQFGNNLKFDGFISDFTFPTLEADDSRVMSEAPDVFMNNHYFEAELPRHRHTMVSSLYYALYDLSPQVLSYLIDQFDGRLSILVDSFETWSLNNEMRTADKGQLVAFTSSFFGRRHPATSLVRYMTALAGMVRPSRRQAVGTEIGLGAPRSTLHVYAINSEARLLRDIDDCPALLDRLAAAQANRRTSETLEAPALSKNITWRHGAASPQLLARQAQADILSFVKRHKPVTISSVGSPADFLVVPIKGTDQVRNIRLDRDIKPLLRLFRRPVSLADLRGTLGRKRTPVLIRELISLDAITAVRQSP